MNNIIDNGLKIPSDIEDIIIPLLHFNNKLILTGSVSLYLNLILKPDNIKFNDIDFAITSPLTKDEIILIKDFFNLKFRNTIVSGLDEDEDELFNCDILLNNIINEKKLVPFKKIISEDYSFKIDVFLNQIDEKDYEYYSYKAVDDNRYLFKITKPYVPLMHKVYYAFSSNNSPSSKKHKEDLKTILNSYF